MAVNRKETNHAVDPKAMNTFLLMLAKCINPDTGKIYTHEELAGIFYRHPSSIAEFLNGHNVYRRPPPELSDVSIPGNERAFYLGLMLGNFQVEQVTWAHRKYLAIGTNSQNPGRRELLRRTIGTRGEIHENQGKLRIYFNLASFSFLSPEFMANPDRTNNYVFLKVKSQFAPFMAGFLAACLSEKEHRLSFPTAQLRDEVCHAFELHYGFPLGNSLKRDVKSFPIAVHNPSRVFQALLETQSVHTLPFVRAFASQPA